MTALTVFVCVLKLAAFVAEALLWIQPSARARRQPLSVAASMKSSFNKAALGTEVSSCTMSARTSSIHSSVSVVRHVEPVMKALHPTRWPVKQLTLFDDQPSHV